MQKDRILTSRVALAKKIAIAVLWIAIWELVYVLIGKDIYFPSVQATVKVFVHLIGLKSTWVVIAASVMRTLAALLISIGLGIILGILCGIYQTAHDIVNPLIVILKSTPVVSVIILAIICFRSSEVPIFAGILMCLPIVFNATVSGIKNTDVKLLQMFALYRVSWLDSLRYLYIPSAISYIHASIIISIGICFKAVCAAEVLSMPDHSIGLYLYFSKTALDPASLFAWTAIIICLSYLFERLYARGARV